jgi:hypothetical protein
MSELQEDTRVTLKELIDRYGIRIENERVRNTPHTGLNEWDYDTRHWKARLSRPCARTGHNQPRRLTVPFSQGSAHTAEPTAYDVLNCLLLDASSADEDFDYWCGNYGYDTDSRKAERIYKLVRAQTKKLRRFLGPEFDEFLQAEQE